MNAKTTQKIMNLLFKTSGLITILIMLVILSYILIKGLPVIDLEFIFTNPVDSGSSGGIFPMIVSTIYMISVSLAISVPIGVGVAIYMVEYAKNTKFIIIMSFIFETLASIPSVIFGLFGLTFFIIFLKLDWSIFSASLVLALMMIPTIYEVSEVALKSVCNDYRQASLALGASKSQTIFNIILPSAVSIIFSGVMLAVMRAVSEAAAVMYVAGSSLSVPISVFDSGRPLALHLYILASEGISMENAYGTAAVLVIFILAITVISNLVIERYERRILK